MTEAQDRKDIAADTIGILDRSFYINKFEKIISIEHELHQAVSNTEFYRPDDFDNQWASRDSMLAERQFEMSIEVVNETTLTTARRLNGEGEKHLLALNFASALHPGGGFLNGANAQEESLARASGLFSCLKPQKEYYETNRQSGTALYTDAIIYSPAVPVFRRDDGGLLNTPYPLSMLTCPAVNRGAVGQKESENLSKVSDVMKLRIEKMLAISFNHGHETLILGAWGCGVFGNDATEVAELFKEQLRGVYKNAFKRVVFAVLDTSENLATYSAFNYVLNS